MNWKLRHKQVLGDPAISEALAWSFDFEISAESHSDRFKPRGDWGATVLAHDTMGGIFAVCTPLVMGARPILFVSSELQADVIGASFDEFMVLLITTPYWRDLLKFSGGGDLARMREAAPYLEDELLEDNPQTFKERDQLLQSLGLEPLPDPIGVLHANVNRLSPGYKVTDRHEEELQSLIGNLTVADNLQWKSRSLRQD